MESRILETVAVCVVLGVLSVTGDQDFPLVGSGEYVTVQLGRNETSGRSFNDNRQSEANRLADSSEIKFPEVEERPVRRKHVSPPLTLLRALANEPDIEKIISAYVDNADIRRDPDTGNNILVDRLGNPVKDRSGNQVVTSLANFRPSKQSHQTQGKTIMRTTMSSPSILPFSTISERSQPQPKVNMVSQPSYSKFANCRPEEKTVELPVDEPHLIYHPRCVRVERCGGCCGSDLFVCEPSQEETISIDVQKFEYIGDGLSNRLNITGIESISIERHKACTCNCRVKASDCSNRHVYVESDCQCKCKNAQEHDKCVEDPRKYWDVSSCACLCREFLDCNSGYAFDHMNTCECKKILQRSPSTQRTKKRKRTPQMTHL